MLEVKIKGNNYGGDWECCLCGEIFQLTGITAILYIDGERKDDICLECFKGGPREIKRQLMKHALELREKSETIAQEMLDRAAKDEGLATAEIVCPSEEEWNRLFGKWLEHWQDESGEVGYPKVLE